MTTVNDILQYVQSLAPAYMKESWDNVGLLCGRGSQCVTKVLVALDPFENVCQEAVELGAQLIVTHHPLIFSPVKAITEDDSVGRAILTLIRNDISAINAHTNLDCTPGGVNDTLAARLGLENVSVLSPSGTNEAGEDWGLLRYGEVPEQPLEDFLAAVKTRLMCPGLKYVSGGKPVHKVAVGGGACAGFIAQAANAGCDTFVTSDIKYNQFWDARALGLNLIDAGHFYTENPVCAVLAKKLQAQFPDIQVCTSDIHTDCAKFFM